MTALRALLWMPRASDIPGGHRVQFEQTAKALIDLGIEVSCSFDVDPGDPSVDIVHGFGLDASQIQEFRSRRVPVVLSTIYGNRAWRVSAGEWHPTLRSRLSKVKRAVRMAGTALKPRVEFVQLCLDEVRSEVTLVAAYSSADLLLPNADGEARSIVDELGIDRPMHVVPNAVDPARFLLPEGTKSDRTNVLCVGRIEPHKNQLGLIRALRGGGYDLVIAGPAHPHHRAYEEECHRAGDGWVTFLGDVPHDRLVDHYLAARVHVLPTWFETTGLVSLEAALAGCAIVSTSRGYAQEYFGEFAHYCDPADPPSIRSAVEHAFRTGPRAELTDRILSNYTWKHAAKATADAYRLLVPLR